MRKLDKIRLIAVIIVATGSIIGAQVAMAEEKVESTTRPAKTDGPKTIANDPKTIADSPKTIKDGPKTIKDAHPGLASAALLCAKPSPLPQGVLLRAGKLTVTQKDIDAEIAKAPKPIHDQLRKNAFFLLEQMVSQKLIVQEVKADADKDGKDTSKIPERELLHAFFDKLTNKAKVTDKEVAQFYEKNRDMIGERKLEEIKDKITKYLLQKKQMEIVKQHVDTLGQRVEIQLNESWLKRQAVLAKDNPVSKARDSGKPSMVNFSSNNCPACVKLDPILKALKQKFDGKINVVVVLVQEEQILAALYSIRGFPTQIFFDKDGKEIFRHPGYWPQEELEKKITEMSAK